MNFVGIMARNLGTKEREVLTAPEEQPQQRRTIISDIALPGFRFHPTEEELVDYYLRRMVQGKRNSVDLIASLDLYQYDPWELPAMALMGEREWFFYCPRDKKYPNGARPNRVTTSGYWKATGTDRAVRSTADYRCIGLKKTLVFYTGRAPRGSKTDWIMNEYRIPNPVDGSNPLMSGSTSMSNAVCSITITQSGYQSFITTNDVALCRIYRKSSSVSSIGLHLESKAREGMVRSSSNHQHLVSSGENTLETSEQKVISSYNQQLLLDSPAQIVMQGSITSAPAAATLSSSSSFDHQVRPEIANSLLSSHAVMARLLEETGCYDGCNSQPIMSLESSIRSTHGGTTSLQQNDTNMGVSNIEGSVPSSSKSNINSNSTKVDGSLEREEPFTDLFQHLHRMQHLDAGPHGNTSRNAAAVQPATDVNEQRILGVCHIPTPPYHSSAGVTEDLPKQRVHRAVQSCSQMKRMYHNNNSNIEVHSRLLLPNIAEYLGLGDQCSPSNSTSHEASTSARLELDAFSSLGFPT